ncbi:hypothetical protein [Gemmiger formicilis]|nr:hypothetical protein [Gemmiger formicilis]
MQLLYESTGQNATGGLNKSETARTVENARFGQNLCETAQNKKNFLV